jgi:hypothetical protein
MIGLLGWRQNFNRFYNREKFLRRFGSFDGRLMWLGIEMMMEGQINP